jgi:hypothetical protein
MGNNRRAQPRCTTTVTLSPEFYDLCKEHRIGFSEAIRVGIALLLADKGVKEYDNKLNLVRKMDLMRMKLEETSMRLAQIEDPSR